MFPQRTKWLKRPIGWEDYGIVLKNYEGDIIYTETHKYCGHGIRTGKENGELFKYCPNCWVKVK